jgi:hypothetical protein
MSKGFFLLTLICLIISVASCGRRKHGKTHGQEITINKITSIDDVSHVTGSFVIEGEIIDIDTIHGAWLILGDKDRRIEVSFSAFTIPVTSKGLRAIIQGQQLTRAYRRDLSGQDHEVFIVEASGAEIY